MNKQPCIKSARYLKTILFSLILCGCLLLNLETQAQKNLTLRDRKSVV